MELDSTLSAITIVSAALTVILVLLQSRGATLGAGFGSSGELFTTRRGFEKNLYETTIVTSVVFVLSIVVGLIVG
ncbi:MAG TPA: preprotein translocase subunit SecG [Candidatus Nanoperiomorbaceae bacterium]|jgi:preprotein translocase subunit SecG|nr:preprotein translocase subunit SecG [Candidatus Nanoperiomorbaceae bacterium]HMQ96835.1 preprotein translocase subunit SecG [Candidatus Nanoperiomorbaceae bacterium]HMR86312.1 preprotein translocase subunit SecG [Candidatus Nanoperiomorbaceae bacterium]HMU11873.1 preprotein translocase subunit SecG [Candidatus Nanoperiomorbaceae bacterium]